MSHHHHHWQGGGNITTASACAAATTTNISGGGGGGGSSGGNNGPCGACKYLRRKCVKGCVFAPYFDSDQGTAHFAAVHKVFGASNAAKLLLRIPAHKRLDAVVTLCYEALSRVRDPVYGCVSHIFSLQQQVLNMQAELAFVQARISTLQCLPMTNFQVDPNPTTPNRPCLDQISSSSSSTPVFNTGLNSQPAPTPTAAPATVEAGLGGFCNLSQYDQDTDMIIEDGDLQTLTREFVSKYLPGVRFKSEPH